MADIISRDGTWSFDGDTVRIVPGGKAHPVRQDLGELAVPLHAVAGVSFEPDRKGGRLRLRLRAGACPVLRAADGRLKDAADPYQLVVEKDRTGVAEYLVDEIRNALLIEQVPDGPVDGFLLPGPSVPVSGGGGDGTASFDGQTVRLTWNWKAEESKTAGGTVTLPLPEVTGVRWVPAIGLENGSLRFDGEAPSRPRPPSTTRTPWNCGGCRNGSTPRSWSPRPSSYGCRRPLLPPPPRSKPPRRRPYRPLPRPPTTTTSCCAGSASWARCTRRGS